MAPPGDAPRDALREGIDARKKQAYLERARVMFDEDPRIILNDPAQFGMKTAEEIQASKNYPEEKGLALHIVPGRTISTFIKEYFESSFGLTADQARRETALTLFYLTNYQGMNVDAGLGRGLIAIWNGKLNVWRETEIDTYTPRLSDIELRPPAGMINSEEASRSGSSGKPPLRFPGYRPKPGRDAAAGASGKPLYTFPGYRPKPGRDAVASIEPSPEPPSPPPSPEGIPEKEQQAREKALAGNLRGIEAYKQQKYDDAITEYRAAYEYYPFPIILYNRGLAHEDKGERERAIDAYEHYLREAPQNEPQRADAQTRLARLRQQAPPPSVDVEAQTTAIPETLHEEFRGILDLLLAIKQKLLGNPVAGARPEYQNKTRDNIAFAVWPGSFASEVETFRKIFFENYNKRQAKKPDEYLEQMRRFQQERDRLIQKAWEITEPLSEASKRFDRIPKQYSTLLPWKNLSNQQREITLIYDHHELTLDRINEILVRELYRSLTPPPVPPPTPREKPKAPELSDNEKMAQAKKRYEAVRMALWGSLKERYKGGVHLFAQFESLFERIDFGDRSVTLEAFGKLERKLDEQNDELQKVGELVKSAGWFRWWMGFYDFAEGYNKLQKDITEYKDTLAAKRERFQELLDRRGR